VKVETRSQLLLVVLVAMCSLHIDRIFSNGHAHAGIGII